MEKIIFAFALLWSLPAQAEYDKVLMHLENFYQSCVNATNHSLEARQNCYCLEKSKLQTANEHPEISLNFDFLEIDKPAVFAEYKEKYKKCLEGFKNE